MQKPIKTYLIYHSETNQNISYLSFRNQIKTYLKFSTTAHLNDLPVQKNKKRNPKQLLQSQDQLISRILLKMKHIASHLKWLVLFDFHTWPGKKKKKCSK